MNVRSGDKVSVHYIEQKVQDAIASKNLDRLVSSLELLAVYGLGYTRTKYCCDITNVAKYIPRENFLRILDFKEFENADKQLFNDGIKEISSGEVFYKLGTTCAHFITGVLRKKEGFIPKVEFQGWINEKSTDLSSLWDSSLRVTDLSFYGWGKEMKGEGDDSYDGCIKPKLKVPKNEIIKKLTLQEVMKKMRSRSS